MTAGSRRRGPASTSVAEALERISTLNPTLNAFITVFEAEAMAQAKVLDDELRQGRSRGLLHGRPISVKDLIDVKGSSTTAASRVRADPLARRLDRTELVERATRRRWRGHVRRRRSRHLLEPHQRRVAARALHQRVTAAEQVGRGDQQDRAQSTPSAAPSSAPPTRSGMPSHASARPAEHASEHRAGHDRRDRERGTREPGRQQRRDPALGRGHHPRGDARVVTDAPRGGAPAPPRSSPRGSVPARGHAAVPGRRSRPRPGRPAERLCTARSLGTRAARRATLARVRCDAVVIGAGHNGLVCGAYLARAGLRVLIVERRERVGGAPQRGALAGLPRSRAAPTWRACCGPPSCASSGSPSAACACCRARPRRSRRCRTVAGCCSARPRADEPAHRSAASPRATPRAIRTTRRSSTASRAGSSRCSMRRRPTRARLRARDLPLSGAAARGAWRLRRELPQAHRAAARPGARALEGWFAERAAARDARDRRRDRRLRAAVGAGHRLRALPPRDGRDARRARRLGLRGGRHGRPGRRAGSGRARRGRRDPLRRAGDAHPASRTAAREGVVLADGERDRRADRGLERRRRSRTLLGAGRTRAPAGRGRARARSDRRAQRLRQAQPRAGAAAASSAAPRAGAGPRAPRHDPRRRDGPRRASSAPSATPPAVACPSARSSS